MNLDLQVRPLMPIVEQALEANQSYGDSLGVRFALIQRDDTNRVRVNQQRMMQVLDDFLSNAAKFSPKGGVVEVGFETETGRGTRFTFCAWSLKPPS